MKAILLSLAFAIGLGAHAQKSGHAKKSPEQKAAHRTEQLVKDLGLDAGQEGRVSSINLFYYKGMRNVNTIADDRSRENRAKVLKGNRDNALRDILSAEQYTKMLSLRAERKAKHKAGKKAKSAD